VDRTAHPNQAPGIAGLRQNIAAFRTAFPDGRVIVRELIADHDKVVARVTLSGTHVADYFGIPPSGKHMVADGIETFRFLHGMVVESWSMFGDLKQRDKPVDEVVAPRRERRGIFNRLGRRRVRSSASGVQR
jgi:predicted ester cyclase